MALISFILQRLLYYIRYTIHITYLNDLLQVLNYNLKLKKSGNLKKIYFTYLLM